MTLLSTCNHTICLGVVAKLDQTHMSNCPCSCHCEGCDGMGYGLFVCDGKGHEPLEIQACDQCSPQDQTDGAVAFVRALEGDDLRADRIALALIAGDPELEHPPGAVVQEDALRELVSAVRIMLDPDGDDPAKSVQRVGAAVRLFDNLEV